MSVSGVSAVPPAPPPREGATFGGQLPVVEPQNRLAAAVQIDIASPESRGQDRSAAPKLEAARVEAAAKEERRITVDDATKAIVYQVIDPGSGDVLVQSPDASVLKTRAYVAVQAARQQSSERRVDRQA